MKAEPNIHFEDPVSTKTARRLPDKSKVHGRTAIAEPLTTESNTHTRGRLCGLVVRFPSYRSRGSRSSLYQEQFTFGEHARKYIIQNAWSQ
jgi:hypothetical protein